MLARCGHRLAGSVLPNPGEPMSVEKAELRADVVNEMGNRIEDLLEGSQAQVHRAEGAEQAMRQAATIVRQLHEHIDRELEAKQIPDLEHAQLAKDWITRAAGVLDQFAEQQAQQRVMQAGHAQGVALAVRVLKSAHTEELKQLAHQRDRDTDTEFRSIKAERLAEAADEADSASRAPSETPSQAPGPDNGAPRTRRRKRAVNADAQDA